MTHVLDTHYAPAVADSRRLALARIEAIAGRLRTKAHANRFLLSLFALRVGPLRSIPDWLQTSAVGCKDGYPAIAADLFETAKLERSHQLLLLEDLVRVLRNTPGIDFRALIRGPFDPRVDHHLRLRKLVPIGSMPAIVLAIDLELAQLDRDGGAVLIDACHRALGPPRVGCGFLRLRQRSAEHRMQMRLGQLRTVLGSGDTAELASSWAMIASNVLLSYVDVLDSCAARTHSTSPTVAAQRRPSNVQVTGIERVLGDELATGPNLVAH